MKKTLILLIMLSTLFMGINTMACVGKTLFIGVSNSPDEILFAEMISVLVSERTGTTVKISSFKDFGDMYKAVGKGEVGVIVEKADRALKVLGVPAEGNPKEAYDAAKRGYRSRMNLVWLEPFGDGAFSAPVVSMETINNLPALPKLVNKLGGKINDETCARLLRSVNAGENPRKVAKDFLKSRKLI